MNARPDLEASDERIARRLGLWLLFAAIVAPMAWALGYSVLYSTGGIGLLSQGWTLQHWRSALTSGGLISSLGLSLTVAAVSTSLASLGALGITLVAPPARGRQWLSILLCLPLATPAAVSALLAYQILSPGGLIGRLAFHTGAITSPSEFLPFVNDRWAIGIVVTQTLTAVPLLTLFFRGAWTTAHLDRFCRLAESLGATPRQARLNVALPMLARRGAPLMMLVGLWQLGTYEIPLLLGRQSPQMFSVLTQRHFGQFDLHQRPEAFTLAVTYLLLAVTGLLLFLRGRSHAAHK